MRNTPKLFGGKFDSVDLDYMSRILFSIFNIDTPAAVIYCFMEGFLS